VGSKQREWVYNKLGWLAAFLPPGNPVVVANGGQGIDPAHAPELAENAVEASVDVFASTLRYSPTTGDCLVSDTSQTLAARQVGHPKTSSGTQKRGIDHFLPFSAIG
jgi:hypothetical protein